MDKNALIEGINALKKEKNAIILAHNYQNPEIQDIADFVGDSLELAKISEKIKEEVIVLCGVFFMAETSHMLAPDKQVLLPVLTADCPMARMITKEDVLKLKEVHPKAAVVTYVNSTADVKAVSDICCTSSNAMKVIQSLKEEEIIFIPDRNLGRNMARFIAKKFIYHEGFCPTHEEISEEEMRTLKDSLPHQVEIIMHPEVNPKIAAYADKLLSTGGILKYAQISENRDFIIGTEMGMHYRLEKIAPQNRYFNIGRDMVCPNMKKIHLQDVYDALSKGTHLISLPADVREKAKAAIDR
ncbi:MAG: quinolinate synthase, partial [Spirochaetae bacterium HGW-Spirochaetae-6]